MKVQYIKPDLKFNCRTNPPPIPSTFQSRTEGDFKAVPSQFKVRTSSSYESNVRSFLGNQFNRELCDQSISFQKAILDEEHIFHCFRRHLQTVSAAKSPLVITSPEFFQDRNSQLEIFVFFRSLSVRFSKREKLPMRSSKWKALDENVRMASSTVPYSPVYCFEFEILKHSELMHQRAAMYQAVFVDCK